MINVNMGNVLACTTLLLFITYLIIGSLWVPVKYAVAAVATGLAGCIFYVLRSWKQKPRRRVLKLPDTWNYVGKLSHVYIYPVKSCAPVVMKMAECTTVGLKDGWLRDRVMMVINQKSNFVTARCFPELLRIKPSIQGSVLTLLHEDMDEPTRVNLAEVLELVQPVNATVWGVQVNVLEFGFEACEWMSRLLDKSFLNFRLVLHASEGSRKIRGSSNDNAEKFTEDDMGVFPDETSYNLINEASVADLNSRFEDDTVRVTHRNFRPNFVVKGSVPFDEDNWTFVKIGPNVFENIKPCQRCIMTTIDPETGMKSTIQEPLRTLKTYRQMQDPVLRRTMGSSPRMGLQMALRSGPGGHVAVDDDVYWA